MVDFDSAVGRSGLVEGARAAQRFYIRQLSVHQSERIPAGSFLALSNHPGITDTLSLFCALARPDLKIIALQRPFLEALPYVAKQLFYVDDDPAKRLGVVRRVSSHLRAGGAALTFPAGKIEPDPNVSAGAIESLSGWTDSAGVFIRLAPDTPILPVLVRGVVWSAAAKHPLLRIKSAGEERERLAAALQLLVQVLLSIKPVHVRVQIGNPVNSRELGTTNIHNLHEAVIHQMSRLINNPPDEPGQFLL